MAKTKFAPLPRVTTKTITVGALLGKIKRLILAKPERLDMRDFVLRFGGRRLKGSLVGDDVHVENPACGTVACMAGWGAVMLRPEGISGQKLDRNASRALINAIGYDQCGQRVVGGLFACGETPFDKGYMPDSGTPEHASYVAKRIETYLSQHPEIVRRKIVVANVQKALRS